MFGLHRWTTIGLATSTGLLGLTVTSGLGILAHRFVEEFSRPHALLDESVFSLEMPRDAQDPPLSYQHALLFQASDGTVLRGDFWAQPQLAPTVILCHGYRINRNVLRSSAAHEYNLGFNILFFDFRGHGDSDSVLTSGGNAEVRDLEAAIEVATRQPETLPGKIILHGFSMGASVALLTPPSPHVAAIIADSPYARSDDIMRRIVHYQMMREIRRWPFVLRYLSSLFPALVWLITSLGFVGFRVRYGYDVIARPDTSFKRWKRRAKTTLRQHAIPILLVHTTGDDLIPITHAQQIATEAKACDVPLETFFVEGGSHCGAYGVSPRHYNQRVREFLSSNLGNDFPASFGDIA
ncbi:MAG: alpha/beta hydrolase [Ktedonobacteraceae bacterium]